MIKIILVLLGLSILSVKGHQEGTASWYGIKCNGGRQTSSGVPLDDSKLTAAHRTLPNGTKVKVTNLKNKKSVILTITDHGPARWTKRILDCSVAAAKALDFYKQGLIELIK